VFSCYITGGMEYLTEAQCIEIRRYLFGQIKAEGGWGMYETAHAWAAHARFYTLGTLCSCCAYTPPH